LIPAPPPNYINPYHSEETRMSTVQARTEAGP
jgi:hypothetical protein